MRDATLLPPAAAVHNPNPRSRARYIHEFDAVTEGHVGANDEPGGNEGVPSADPLRTLVIARRLGRDWPALRDAHFRNNMSWQGQFLEAPGRRLFTGSVEIKCCYDNFFPVLQLWYSRLDSHMEQ